MKHDHQKICAESHPIPGTEFDRRRAARLLRAARAVSAQSGSPEAIDWAFSVLPDSIPARRLKINALLEAGDLDAAAALIARGRLDHPNCPSLGLLWGRTLTRQNQWKKAHRILRGVLEQRPFHAPTLQFVAEVSLRCKQPEKAVALLSRAVARHPRRENLRHQLISALLEANDPKQAEAELHRLDSPPPLLAARVLRRRGRRCDARNLLEHARLNSPSEADACTVELIDLLEETGDFLSLSVLLESFPPVLPPVVPSEIPSANPSIALRAGQAMLSLGWFARAIEIVLPLADDVIWQENALRTLIVAGALSGRHDLACGALTELRMMARGDDHRLMGEFWRRGLLGRIMVNGERHGIPLITDPPAILPGMVARARRVLESSVPN